MLSESVLARAGIDAVALKPTDVDVLSEPAADREVRVTTPIRADGFDPLER